MINFEDEFSAKQTDMIQLALEYADKVEQKVDTVYIYGSNEKNSYSFNIFYISENKIFTMRTLPRRDFDDLNKLIFHVLKIGTDDVKELKKICEKYNQPMPTQIKLIYDNKQNKVKGKYSYDLFYSNSDTLTSGNIFEQWYNEVKKEIEGNHDI